MSKNKNDITGDSIITRAPSEKFSNGWAAIWGNKKVQEPPAPNLSEQTENAELTQQ